MQLVTTPCLGKPYVQAMEDPFTEDNSEQDNSEAEQDGTTITSPDVGCNTSIASGTQAHEGRDNSNMSGAADESYQIQMYPQDPLSETENLIAMSNQDSFIFNDAAPTWSG